MSLPSSPFSVVFPYVRVILLGLVSAGFWYQIYSLENLRASTGLFVTLFLILFVLYLGVVWKHRFRLPVIIIGLVFAVLFRAIMFMSVPSQSNDIYRYVWDGHVMHHSINPYDHPPSSPELVELQKTPFYSNVGFLQLNTIYPPLAQMVFYVGYALTPETFWGMKALIILFDLGIIGVLLWILRMLKRPLGAILIYAWHPLVIFEYASSGHNDAIMVFFLVLACAFVLKGKSLLSWASMGLSIAAKISPMFLIPWFWKHLRWWTVVVLPVVIGLTILPFISAGDHIVLEGMKQYGGSHEFNSSLYALFAHIFPAGQDLLRTVLSGIYVLFVILFFFCYRTHTHERFFRGIIWLFGVYLLLATNAHPWYLLWIIPFFTVVISPTWFVFSGLVILSYFHYQQFIHVPNYLASVAQYLPLYALMFFELGFLFAQHREHMNAAFAHAHHRISKAFQFSTRYEE